MENITILKGIYTIYGLDTINGLLLSTKELTKEQCQTDWHLDEVFPGYRVVIRQEDTLDEILDYVVKEYYTFKPGEREWCKKEIESYLNQGVEDLVLDWPSSFQVKVNKLLDDNDINYYCKRTGLSREEFLLKMEEGRKNNTEKVVFKDLSTLSVKPFNRDEVIKSLNGELFGLKKWEYIQSQLAKGESRD